MVTITITPSAFAVIASLLPKGYAAVGQADEQGGFRVALDPRARDRLNARRRPGESYSDVILRLARGS
jgi:hypothetical protein